LSPGSLRLLWQATQGRQAGTKTACGRVGLQVTSARNNKTAEKTALVKEQGGKSVVRSYAHVIAEEMIKELVKLGTKTGPQLHSSAPCPHDYFFLLTHVCIAVRSAKSV